MLEAMYLNHANPLASDSDDEPLLGGATLPQVPEYPSFELPMDLDVYHDIPAQGGSR